MKPYEAPTLTLVGSVTELTQAHHHHHPPVEKNYASSSDGYDYQDRPINFS